MAHRITNARAVVLCCAGALSPATAPSQALPDLTVPSVSAAGVQGDWQTLEISGSASAEVHNAGTAGAGAFAVLFFEDRDGNRTYQAGTDVALGTAAVPSLAAGAQVTVTAAVTGTVLFRGNLIFAFADAQNAVAELDETNNVQDSGQQCGAPDLTASFLRFPPCNQNMSIITVRVGNGGSASARRFTPVSFYDGDPALGATRIGTPLLPRTLVPGDWEDVHLLLPGGFPYRGVITAVADDSGGLQGTVAECDETNNQHGVPACTTRAAYGNYGNGWPGTTGVPAITLDDRPILGATVRLRIENSSGSTSPGCILYGLQQASTPTVFGGTLLVQQLAMVPQLFPPGIVSYAVRIPCRVELCGQKYYVQAVQADPGASLGVSFTPGLEMVVGSQ